MNATFWILAVPVWIACFALGWWSAEVAKRWYRRRAVRREVARMRQDAVSKAERQRLEAIATARLRRVH